jgi:hypothetical protein
MKKKTFSLLLGMLPFKKRENLRLLDIVAATEISQLDLFLSKTLQLSISNFLEKLAIRFICSEMLILAGEK